MKLETTAGILKSALSLANLVTERRNTIPVLGCILFDGPKITATDLDMAIDIPMSAAKATGKACIALHPLLCLVRHIDADDTVKIVASDNKATISFNGGRYDLPSLPATDFPEFNGGDGLTTVEVGDDLKAALKFTSPFISTEETRYYLNGVVFEPDKIVATDGHRLGCHPIKFDASAFERSILPRKTVSILCGLPSAKSITYSSLNKRMAFDLGGCVLRSKTIDGTFPDWQRVVPKSEPDDAYISVERLVTMRSIRRIMSLQARSYLSLSFDTKRAVLAGSTPDSGAGREFLSCTAIRAEKGGVVGFQSHYLHSALEAFLGKERVDLVIRDGDSPVLLAAEGDGPFAVVMPARALDEKLAVKTLSEWAAADDLARVA